MAGEAVQVHAQVAGKMLGDIRRGLQAATAEHLKAVVRDLPRAKPGTPEKDGYIRKSTKKGGSTAKRMSATVLASGLETWMVDGSGIADQIHKKGAAGSDLELPKIVEKTMGKAQAALEAQLKSIGGSDDIGAQAHAAAAGAGDFIKDAPKHLQPPPEWAAIMAGASGRIR